MFNPGDKVICITYHSSNRNLIPGYIYEVDKVAELLFTFVGKSLPYYMKDFALVASSGKTNNAVKEHYRFMKKINIQKTMREWLQSK